MPHRFASTNTGSGGYAIPLRSLTLASLDAQEARIVHRSDRQRLVTRDRPLMADSTTSAATCHGLLEAASCRSPVAVQWSPRLSAGMGVGIEANGAASASRPSLLGLSAAHVPTTPPTAVTALPDRRRVARLKVRLLPQAPPGRRSDARPSWDGCRPRRHRCRASCTGTAAAPA